MINKKETKENRNIYLKKKKRRSILDYILLDAIRGALFVFTFIGIFSLWLKLLTVERVFVYKQTTEFLSPASSNYYVFGFYLIAVLGIALISFIIYDIIKKHKKMNNVKKKEKFIFALVFIILLMLGIAFNSDINKGLFKENSFEKVKEIKSEQKTQFSKKPLLNWMPIVASLFIILIAIFVKHDVNLNNLKPLKRTQHKIDNMKGIDVRKIINKFKK